MLKVTSSNCSLYRNISCVSYLCNLILWFMFISLTTLPHVTCKSKHISSLSGTSVLK